MNLYDVIIFDTHWVICMLSFSIWHQYSPAQSFLIHTNLTDISFPSSSEAVQNLVFIFFFLCLKSQDQKIQQVMDCITWFHWYCPFQFSGVMALKGKTCVFLPECVIIWSTLSLLAQFDHGFPKARTHYFPFCLTF